MRFRPARKEFFAVLTLLLACSTLAVPAQESLVISEFMASNGRALGDENGDHPDWIEIHNAGLETVNLEGWYLADSPNRLTRWRFPATNLAAGGYLVVFASGKDRRTPEQPLHTNFKLRDGGEYLALVRPDGVTVAHAYAPSYPEQVRDVSFGLGQASREVELLRARDPIRWTVPEGTPGRDWVNPEFDDTDWAAGTNAVGFDLTADKLLRPRIITDVRKALHGTNGGLYLRAPFVVEDPGRLQDLVLRVQYNDGFALYLNGVELLRRNAPRFAPGGVVADSVAEFSGVQGQDGWFYGYYDRLADSGGRYAPDDFTLFPRRDEPFGRDNFWTGTRWDWPNGNPPWTMISATECHPNSRSNGPEHWAIRRWRSDVEGTLLAHLYFAKADATCGRGVIAGVYHNQQVVYTTAIPFDDTAGVQVDLPLPKVLYGDSLDFMVMAIGGNPPSDTACNTTRLTVTLDQESSPPLTWDSVATDARTAAETLQTEEIPLTGSRSLLLRGTNVLALHALNADAADETFLMRAELTALTGTPIQPDRQRYFQQPTPGNPNGAGVVDLGPIISDVEHYPRVPSPGEEVVVTARIREGFAPVATNILYHRVMFQAEVPTPMLDDGAHGDGAAGDGIYGATIPAAAVPAGQMIRWYIVSKDSEDRASRWPLYPDRRNSARYLGTMVHAPQTNQLEILHLFVSSPSAANSDAGTRCSLFYLGEFYDNLSINRHGQSSRGFPKKSYDIDFNPDHHFRYSPNADRVDDINLLTTYPDKAHLRNILAYETYRRADAPYHFVYPVRVQMNGNFWGDAHLVENGDDNWLKRIGRDPDGALYKMYNSFTSSSDTGIGVNGRSAEKKTRKNEGNADLRALFRGVVQQSGEARRRYLYDHLNIPEMVNYLAARIITGDKDCCHKNYYFYRDTEETGEWQAMPWDVDLSFGRNWISSKNYWDDIMHPENGLFLGSNNGVFNALFTTPEIRRMYLRRIRTLMEELLQAPDTPPGQLKYEQRIDELAGIIEPDAALDFGKWPTWGNGNAISRCCTQTMRQAVDILKNQYLPQRRQFMFQRRISGGRELPDSQPANAAILFKALEYAPASHNQDEEYLALLNPNRYAVDISRWRISGGVRFTFAGGTVIPARGTLHVSPNVAAFRRRATSPKGGEARFVVGPYQGQLSARGEELVLTDPTGRVVHTMSYPGAPTSAQRYLRITEIMYHPAPPPAGGIHSIEDFEYLELKNIGPESLDLAGVQLVAGVTFDFTGSSVTTLEPGETVLLVRNRAAFESRYGDGHRLAGIYTGNLDNGGERLRLLDAHNEEILDFRYRDDWYPVTDGLGFSLVVADEQAPFTAWEEKAGWRASSAPGGSPGEADLAPVTVPPVWVNEVLTRTAGTGAQDAVELYNPGEQPVDLGGWWLTDDFALPNKFRIPDDATIPAGGYLVFDERDFQANPDAALRFAFSAKGDQVYLFAATPDGVLTGYVHGYEFGAAEIGVSFGRHVNSVGEVFFVPQQEVTLGAPNSLPRAGPVVIAQIMYHPPDFGYFEKYDNTLEEYVELRNITNHEVPLFDLTFPQHTWRLRGGVDFEFPEGLTLPPGGRVVLVNVDPLRQPREWRHLRGRFGFGDDTPVLGPYRGKLNNAGDRLRLERPVAARRDKAVYLWVDEVEYRDEAPWPAEADGTGLALRRINLNRYGNDPTNWMAGPVIRPNILEPPADALVPPGQEVTFQVRVEHPDVVTYQWFYNDATIVGATNATLRLRNVQMENQGEYSVQVANIAGAVMSPVAGLAILIPPRYVAQPQDVTVLEGESVSFSVTIKGNPPPFGFRWQHNGVTLTNLVLATPNAAFNIPSVRFVDAGVYTVVVTNAALTQPGMLSRRARLTVLADADRDHMADPWEIKFGLDPANPKDAWLDLDGDGQANVEEYQAGTSPTDPGSVLRFDHIAVADPIQLQFTAMSNHTYSVQVKWTLDDGEWSTLADVSVAPTNRTVTVTDPTVDTHRFYRLRTPREP